MEEVPSKPTSVVMMDYLVFREVESKLEGKKGK